MKDATTYLGMDVHKREIVAAMLVPGCDEPTVWTLEHKPRAVRKLIKRLGEIPGEVAACYEAGPCGYALQRLMRAGSIRCEVIAPSLIPVKAGDRIKTDRRDARKLAQLFRAGLLTAVEPPDPTEEAARDLGRCRDCARQDLLRARHRVSKMLLRRGLLYDGGAKAWTRGHRRWLASIEFELPTDQVTYAQYLLAIDQAEERVATLDEQLAALAALEPYRSPVAALRCFRGIDTLTAILLVVELYRFGRFSSPRSLMAYLGLVPSEDSSGDRCRRGSITKAGNRQVRRLLVEASHHYRHAPAVSKDLRRRRQGQPAEAIARADKAQQRLYRRFVRLRARGKPVPVVVTSVARELAGFVWAAMQTAG